MYVYVLWFQFCRETITLNILKTFCDFSLIDEFKQTINILQALNEEKKNVSALNVKDHPRNAQF